MGIKSYTLILTHVCRTGESDGLLGFVNFISIIPNPYILGFIQGITTQDKKGQRGDKSFTLFLHRDQ